MGAGEERGEKYRTVVIVNEVAFGWQMGIGVFFVLVILCAFVAV